MCKMVSVALTCCCCWLAAAQAVQPGPQQAPEILANPVFARPTVSGAATSFARPEQQAMAKLSIGDTCETATEIPGLPFSHDGYTCPWTHDYDEACPNQSTSPDVVYVFHPVTDVLVDISLCGNSMYDTKVFVYENTCAPGFSIACNDDDCFSPGFPWPWVSRLSGLWLTGGNAYYIVIDGYNGECGYYTLDVYETVPPPGCPDGSLFGQGPFTPDGWWEAGLSELNVLGSNYQRFESFAHVSGNVCAVSWWGLQMVYENDVWRVCTEPNPLFTIAFHADDAGMPGAVIQSYSVAPTLTPSGYFYNGNELLYYQATLPDCLTVRDGWVSIYGVDGPDCWFMWMGSPTGDYVSLLSIDGNYEMAWFDVSVCLTGEYVPIYGACCEDLTSTCTDNTELVDCLAPGLRFFEGGTCALLDPPCGQLAGACCHPDGTCEVIPQAACAGLWLGAYTECAQCPCHVPCPPGAASEPEACGQATDNGCNMEPYTFAPIECGVPVCGTVYSTWEFRDTDWYEITVPEQTIFTLTVQPEFDAEFGLLEQGVLGAPGCENMTGYIAPVAWAGGCYAGQMVTECLPAGTYYFFVSTMGWFDLPCQISNDYVATLTCEMPCIIPTGACCFRDLTCAVVMQRECSAAGGRYYGDDVPCEAVQCPTVPENDYCANATPIGDVLDVPFDTFAASFDGPGECIFGPNIWYCYTATCTGDITVELCGGQFNTMLAIYDGCDCLNPVLRECNDDGWDVCGEGWDAAVRFQGLAGHTYLIEVGGGEGGWGMADLSVWCSPAAQGACCVDGLCVGDMIELECHLQGGAWYPETSCAGFTCPPPTPGDTCGRPIALTLSPEALPYFEENTTCGHGDHYNHRTCFYSDFRGEDLVYELTVTAEMCVDIAMSTSYWDGGFVLDVVCPTEPYCLAIGTGENAHAEGVRLTPGVYYLVVDSVLALSCFDYSLSISPCPPPPPGDECSEALCVADGVELITHNFRATGEDISSCGHMDYNDVWFRYTPRVSETVTVDLIGSEFDTVMTIWTACDGVELACNDDFWGLQSQIVMDMTAGVPYLIRVGGYNAEGGVIVLHVTGGQGLCLCGDFDMDGDVDMGDYLTMLDAMGHCAGDERYLAAADFDGDGCVTLVDYQSWMQCYRNANPGAAVQPAAGRQRVRPGEPAGLTPRGDN